MVPFGHLRSDVGPKIVQGERFVFFFYLNDREGHFS